MKLTPHNEDRAIFIAGSGNYSMIHWLNRPAVCESRTIKYYVSKLSPNFIRIHKSYLINKKYIKSVDQIKQRVIMEGGKELQISKRQWLAVEAKIKGAFIDFTLEDLIKLMNYFGWEPIGFMGKAFHFRSKVFSGNHCTITKRTGLFIAKIEFSFMDSGSEVKKQDTSNVKSWEGMFKAVKTHTKSLIYRREVLLQVGQTAA